jgi:hypothetical protein
MRKRQVNKIKPLTQLNPYFKLRSLFSRSSLNKSVSYYLYGLIKHFSQRETLINKVKRFSHKLLLPIAISSLLVGNVTADGYYQVGEVYFHEKEVYLDGKEVYFDLEEVYLDGKEVYFDLEEVYLDEKEVYFNVEEVYLDEKEVYFNVEEGYLDEKEVYLDVEEVYLDEKEVHFDVEEKGSYDDGPYSGEGPYAVELGSAGSFSILSKSGITDVYRSAIVGDVGTSPITGAALLLTCEEVKGNIYTVDAAGPLPCAQSSARYLTAAVSDMEGAYVNAAGRSSPDFIELGAGEIGGLTLEPGLYKWSSGVTISTDVTFSGGPNDVWILQIAGTMDEAVSTKVTLTGGASASNIFWQVAGATTIGSYAHFEGVILSKTMIAVNTGASVNGRLLAQTAVTLQMNTITAPTE